MKKRLDKNSIRNFLTIRYNPLDKPFFKPASWQDFRSSDSDPDGYQSEKLLKNTIYKFTANRKGPYVVSLSSGIDSTLCLALLRKILPKEKIVAICGVFEEGFDESKIAKEIAEKFEADFKIVCMDSIFTHMPEIIAISTRPRWNTYTHLIAKEAKKYGNILVTGDGADEIFGGYNFRYNKFSNLLRPKDNWKIKVINYLECHNRDWVPDQQYLFGSAIKFDWNEIYNYFRPYFTNPLNPLQQVMLADFNGKLLYDFIPTGRAIFEYYKLQSLQIFLDPNLIKFALHLPIEQKYDVKKQKGKLILRKISSRLGVAHIEEKKGFSPELLFDWKKHGKKICQAYLLEKNSYIFKKKLINFNWVLRAFERVENDGDIRYLNRLISLLALEIWYRIFRTEEMSHLKRLS